MKIQENKVKQDVIWPNTPFFIIKDVFNLNPNVKEITLRVRLENAINGGKFAKIGTIPNDKKLGAPQKVIAVTPVTQIILNKAESTGVTLVDNAKQLINVISVSPIISTVPVLSPKVAVS